MSDTRAVSAVIPLYNGARFIEEALSSIQCQRIPVAEILVIDDGSTDAGPDLARAHPAKPRVIRKENSGPSAARNFGIRHAASPFLAFLDQDDLWRPEKLELQFQAFSEDRNLMACFGRVDYFWEDPDCDEARAFRDHPRTNAAHGYVTTTMLVRREIYDIVGFYDETLAHADSIAWCATMRDMGVSYRMLDAVLLDHRMHATNLTRRRERAASEILSVLHQRRQAARTGAVGKIDAG